MRLYVSITYNVYSQEGLSVSIIFWSLYVIFMTSLLSPPLMHTP